MLHYGWRVTEPSVNWSDYGAILFDLDGVLTPTAEVHMAAWSEMFNDFLGSADLPGADLSPYQPDDYFQHVDGKPRYDGVRDFLASRGIVLPEGSADDSPEADTVIGLGNRKNAAFTVILERDGVTPYPGSLALLDLLEELDIPKAVVSSSANAPAVLTAAGLAGRFVTVVDGKVAKAEGLPGKPAPDTFEYAARLCGVETAQAVVVEDAVSGVRAGAAGDFALVIGVDRGVGEQALTDAGAGVVVADLGQLA